MDVTATGLYPFVPSGKDFELAKRFFLELGFDCIWEDGGFAEMQFGAARFLLQNIEVPAWQENQMIAYEVSDLDAYWVILDGKDLAARFPGSKIKQPTDYPWGREIHIIDPAGVCWHVRQG